MPPKPENVSNTLLIPISSHRKREWRREHQGNARTLGMHPQNQVPTSDCSEQAMAHVVSALDAALRGSWRCCPNREGDETGCCVWGRRERNRCQLASGWWNALVCATKCVSGGRSLLSRYLHGISSISLHARHI